MFDYILKQKNSLKSKILKATLFLIRKKKKPYYVILLMLDFHLFSKHVFSVDKHLFHMSYIIVLCLRVPELAVLSVRSEEFLMRAGFNKMRLIKNCYSCTENAA